MACFQSFPIKRDAAVNPLIHHTLMHMWKHIWGGIPKSAVAGSKSMCILDFETYSQITFQRGCPVFLLPVVYERALPALFFFLMRNIFVYFLLKIFSVWTMDKQTCWNVWDRDLPQQAGLVSVFVLSWHLLGSLWLPSKRQSQIYNMSLKDFSINCLLGHKKLHAPYLLAGCCLPFFLEEKVKRFVFMLYWKETEVWKNCASIFYL